MIHADPLKGSPYRVLGDFYLKYFKNIFIKAFYFEIHEIFVRLRARTQFGRVDKTLELFRMLTFDGFYND